MSSHKFDARDRDAEIMDGLIRMTLRDAVVGAEPCPLLWERIRDQAQKEAQPVSKPARVPARRLSRRIWLGWLIGAGASFPVPGDPRVAWQGRLHAFDIRAPLSIVRMVEGSMATMRLVS